MWCVFLSVYVWLYLIIIDFLAIEEMFGGVIVSIIEF